MNVDMISYLKNKKILVTGGAGSIGSALVKKLAELGVRKIRVLDNNENSLVTLKRIVGNVNIYLGDIRDIESIRDAITDVDIVLHAAALKHVPLSEYFPMEYVKTNVIGTQNLVKLSIESDVEKFILISTDKAVNPVNVMGATKLLAEKLVIVANLMRRGRRTKLSCVRFGNVLYTHGSVLDIFLRQIRKGGPITVTDPNMTRFVMSVTKAVELILKATYLAEGGEIFILKMDAVRIIDLAKAFIEVIAPLYGYNPTDITIKIIGRRPGEKFHEELMTELESQRAIELEDMFVIYPELPGVGYKEIKNPVNRRYTSKDAKLLGIDTIKKLIREFFEFYELIHVPVEFKAK